MKKTFLFCAALFIFGLAGFSQVEGPDEDHSHKPLKVDLSEDGAKYIRFITWHQVWATSNNLAAKNSNFSTNFSMRRSRLLTVAQISPKFLILTHIGLNNMSASNLTSLGNNGDAPQFFLHDAWTEFNIYGDHHVGAGLHYWKGLTRLASQSTLNFMTLDQSRPFVHWHSIGITDQFARHLGIYAKGEVGKFHYRAALNNPLNPANSLGAGNPALTAKFQNAFKQDTSERTLSYIGAAVPDGDGNSVGNYIIEAYVNYNFWEKENHKLPYFVGTYLGKKKVMTVGGGFFAHPDGMYDVATQSHESVFHFAGDVFLDYPTNFGCINAYASYQNFNYGKNYMSRWAGTGSVVYAHAGLYVDKLKIMPYAAYQSANYEGLNTNPSALDVGVNYFVNGHHAKLTLEYHSIMDNPFEGASDASGNNQGFQQIRAQAHIYL
jgi:hypothetical protein